MANLTKLQRNAMLLTIGVATAVTLAAGCHSRSQLSGGESTAVEASSLPNAGLAMNFQPTPARLERGKYIVEGPAHCFLCHSDVNWKQAGQASSDKKGSGHKWADYGFPFLFAPNITPDKETGAGTWSDETLARAIREGVGHDGRRLFPIMPYMFFAKMSDEDLASVISYVRSIQPVRNVLPTTALPDEIKNSLPPPQAIREPVPQPDLSDPIKKGEYLVALGNCAECHTPKNEKGMPLPGLDFAGGFVMEGPWGKVASANLTPDPSGLSYYDEALFIQTIRTGQVKARKLSSIMPWSYFRNMTDDDLKGIFAYIRSLKPVQHRVDNTETPTYCEICGAVHGFGDRNLLN